MSRTGEFVKWLRSGKLNISKKDNPFSNVVEQLEHTRDYIRQNNSENAIGTLTGVLLVNIETLGHDEELMERMVEPFLSLKELIERQEFDEALTECLALIAVYRATKLAYDEKLKRSRN